MKKIFLAFCCAPLLSAAQNFHFSGRLGLANYQGDLKEKSISLSNAHILGSLGVRYDLTEKIALRSYLSLTSLSADDKNGTAGMQTRNLNFKTSVFEWEAGAQYSFLDPNDSWWIPYAFAGIGLFHFNPYTKDLSAEKAFLRPLSTEGQGIVAGVKKYKLMQFSIPMGIGIERSLNEDMRIGLELGYRKLFTDYLDDVSTNYIDQSTLMAAKGERAVQLAYRGGEVGAGPYPAAGMSRGAPKYKDGYYYIAVTYTVRYFFDKYKQIAGLPAYRKSKKAGCPASRY